MSLLKDINAVKSDDLDFNKRRLKELIMANRKMPTKEREDMIDLVKKKITKLEKNLVIDEPKSAKPSLMKEFVNNTQTTLKTSDGSDAGKSDVVDKALGDIGFNLMRNTINADGNVTGSDVADYIERAEDLNDEVDTVPFGLETDDGQIVKVYVNAEQADAFEEAMKNMLGMEDDIEEAINRLTTEFDIVDVVWPKGGDEGESGEGAEEDPDADLSIDDDFGDETDDDDDFAEGNYDDISGDAESDTDKDVAKDEKEEAKAELDPDAGDSDEDAEDDEDDSAEDEDEELDDDGKPKKKKKKKAAPAEPASESKKDKRPVLNEQKGNNMTLGSNFLARIIQEADTAQDKDGVKDGFNIPLDSQARALAGKLRLPFAKRLIAFHVMCGVPGRYLNTEDAEGAIGGAADMLRKKPSIRKAFLSMYESLATTKGYTIEKDLPNDVSVREGAESYAISSRDGWYACTPDEEGVGVFNDGPYKNRKQAEEIGKKNFDAYMSKAKKRGVSVRESKETPFDIQEWSEDNDSAADAWMSPKKQKELAKLVAGGKQVKSVSAGDMKYDNERSKFEKKVQKLVDAGWKKFDEEDNYDSMEVVLVKESTLTEAAKRGSYMQKLLESVMAALGLPEALTAVSAPSAVGTGIYRTSELIASDSTLERNLRLLANRLGIKASNVGDQVDDGKSKTNEAKAPKLPKDKEAAIEVQGIKGMKSTPWKKTFKNQAAMEKWMDANGDDITVHRYSTDPVMEAVDIGTSDAFTNQVLGLCAALGIPDVVLSSRKSQLIQGLRAKKSSLRNRGAITTMMTRLESLIEKNTVAPGSQTQADPEDNTNESVAPSRWKFLSAL